MLSIHQAQICDIPALYNHLKRHDLESGTSGDLIFAPFEEPWSRLEDDLLKEKKEKWQKHITEVGWERCWVASDELGIYGEIKLVQQPPLRTSLHRATVMMGIERPYRALGLGSQLMKAALEWAKEQPSLEWLELGVFAHNEPAIRLYEKFCFQEVGRTVDLFRVHGNKIDDIHMTLQLP